MSVVPDNGTVSVDDQLESLSARVHHAKAEAEARGQAIATEARHIHAPPPTAAEGGIPGRRRSWRNVIVALVLALLGIAATAIVVGGDGPDQGGSDSTAVTEGAAAVDRPSATVTGGPATSLSAPVTPDIAVPDPGTPAVSAPVPAPSGPAGSPDARLPPSVTTSDAATTVVVAVGDSLWSIAERQVASAGGGATTRGEVAGYWVELVEANQDRLVHAGDPDLIYPGQTFALP